ncbi:hypothetical protein MHA_1177 [Mannheimia haemolytica PHL213]|nr:hypothetical protein MHA_1177 [Mannheimia haemolytica PHL213]
MMAFFYSLNQQQNKSFKISNDFAIVGLDSFHTWRD